MNEHKCEYCNHSFSNKTNFNAHKKNAKFCLEIRGEEKKNNIFVCDFCSKEFTTKMRLESHLEVCKNFYIQRNISKNESIIQSLEKKLDEKDQQIEKLESQNKDLQDLIERLCNKAIDRPTIINKNNDYNTNNNIMNNIGNLNIEDDKLEDIFMNKLTFEHVMNGQAGIADLLHQHFLTDDSKNPLAICTDRARQMIQYKDSKGNLIKDPKGYNLASKIYNISEKAALRVREGYINDIYKSNADEPSKIVVLEDDEKKIIINKRSAMKLKRQLCARMGIRMDTQKINYYPEDDEEEKIFNYRYEKLKEKTLYKPKKYKKREKLDDNALKYYYRFDRSVPPEDPEFESDYSDMLIEEEEEFYMNNQEEYKLWCKLQELKKEQNEERLNELKTIVEAKGWCQEKKDFYLDKINKGIEDIKLMKINLNKFSKTLSLVLPGN